MKVKSKKNLNNEFKLNVDEQQDDIKYFKRILWHWWHRTPIKKMDVCVTCNQTIAKNFFYKKTYPGKAHQAVVELLWQHVQIKNGIKQSYGYSIWINLSWTTGRTGVNT